MKTLIESFVMIQNLIHGLQLQVIPLYNRNYTQMIQYKGRTMFFIELYDEKHEEKFFIQHNLPLNTVHYNCKFHYCNNQTSDQKYFKTLQELKYFLDDLNLDESIFIMNSTLQKRR